MKHRLNTLIRCIHNNYVVDGTRRYSGHSKWQNIKHTKEKQDSTRAKVFQSLIAKMAVAIKETGITNPVYNTKLSALIDHAKRINMPASTIDTFLKRINSPKKSGETQIIPVRTASGCTLILYVSSSNIAKLRIDLRTIYRKHNVTPTESITSLFECASYITASKNCTLDQATEDAIEVGAEDVEELEDHDQKYFQFKSEFLFSHKVETQLRNLGYSVISIEDTCIPNTVVELSDEELNKVNKLKAKFLEIDGVDKIEDNIA